MLGRMTAWRSQGSEGVDLGEWNAAILERADLACSHRYESETNGVASQDPEALNNS